MFLVILYLALFAGPLVFETNHTHMKNSGPINATVINRAKFACFFVIFWVGGLLLMLFLGVLVDIPFMGIVGACIFFFIPWIFEKRIRKPFCKNAEVHFFDDYFTVALLNIDSGDVEYNNSYKYNEIAEFLTGSEAKSGFSSLRLYLKDGRYIRYIFCETKYSNNSQVEYVDITELFFQYAKDYNKTHYENAITIHPYFATTENRIVLIIISVFIVVGITVVSILKPKIIFPSLIPVLFFYTIVLGAKLSYKRQMKRLAAA